MAGPWISKNVYTFVVQNCFSVSFEVGKLKFSEQVPTSQKSGFASAAAEYRAPSRCVYVLKKWIFSS